MNRKSRRSYSSVLGLVEKARLGWLHLHAAGASSKFIMGASATKAVNYELLWLATLGTRTTLLIILN